MEGENMRTSVDRPVKYSTTELSPCPKCGSNRTEEKNDWWGFDKDGKDTKQNGKGRGFACACNNCSFGYEGDYIPQVFYTREEANVAWNLVANTTTKEEANRGN